MNYRSSLLALSFLAPLFCTALTAQTRGLTNVVIATTGRTSADGAIVVSWTIGEPMILTFETPSFILTQGFHQPIDPIDWTGVVAGFDILRTGGIVLYPNPARDAATIDLPADLVNITAEVINETGVTMKRMELRERRNPIDIRDLPSGRYVVHLRLPNNNSVISTLILTVQR